MLIFHPFIAFFLLAVLQTCSEAYRSQSSIPSGSLSLRPALLQSRQVSALFSRHTEIAFADDGIRSMPPAIAFSTSLENRTLTCLDFTCVLDELRSAALTVLGKDMVSSMHSSDAAKVTTSYAMVEEITNELGLLPLRSSMNVWPVLRQLEVIGR